MIAYGVVCTGQKDRQVQKVCQNHQTDRHLRFDLEDRYDSLGSFLERELFLFLRENKMYKYSFFLPVTELMQCFKNIVE